MPSAPQSSAPSAPSASPARLLLIGCAVLRPETNTLIEELGLAATLDQHWLPTGLHADPERLRAALTSRVAAATGRGYRAVLLLFGLCGRATAGLTPPGDCPLVIPRVHDCVALHLGSAARAAAAMAEEAGTYWFTRGLAAGCRTAADLARRVEGGSLEELRRAHGPLEAAWLHKTLHTGWRDSYRRAVFVRPDDSADAPEEALAREYAAARGWRFETRKLDLRLVRKLVTGEWDGEFTVIGPGDPPGESG